MRPPRRRHIRMSSHHPLQSKCPQHSSTVGSLLSVIHQFPHTHQQKTTDSLCHAGIYTISGRCQAQSQAVTHARRAPPQSRQASIFAVSRPKGAASTPDTGKATERRNAGTPESSPGIPASSFTHRYSPRHRNSALSWPHDAGAASVGMPWRITPPSRYTAKSPSQVPIHRFPCASNAR